MLQVVFSFSLERPSRRYKDLILLSTILRCSQNASASVACSGLFSGEDAVPGKGVSD